LKLLIEVEFGNDAMQTYGDARGVLKGLLTAERLHTWAMNTHSPSVGDGSRILDMNGQGVGKWEVVGDGQ
jgi:hypothetical protein